MTLFFFFFQAEDGIRDRNVTGVQTCALPIFARGRGAPAAGPRGDRHLGAERALHPRRWGLSRGNGPRVAPARAAAPVAPAGGARRSGAAPPDAPRSAPRVTPGTSLDAHRRPLSRPR